MVNELQISSATGAKHPRNGLDGVGRGSNKKIIEK